MQGDSNTHTLVHRVHLPWIAPRSTAHPLGLSCPPRANTRSQLALIVTIGDDTPCIMHQAAWVKQSAATLLPASSAVMHCRNEYARPTRDKQAVSAGQCLRQVPHVYLQHMRGRYAWAIFHTARTLTEPAVRDAKTDCMAGSLVQGQRKKTQTNGTEHLICTGCDSADTARHMHS